MTDPTRLSPLVPPRGWLRAAPSGLEPASPAFLLAVTALAMALRLVALTQQSLWVDEILTWHLVRPGVGLVFLEQIRDNIQGPLFLAVVWPLLRLGDTELLMRLPAALAGIATIPLFGLVVSRLVEQRAARFATLLLAISPLHIWYSQESRGYAFVLLATVAMVWTFLRLARENATVGDALLFALASACAVWSNMSGLFMWVALALTVPFLRPGRRQWLLWLVAFGGGLLAAAPWLAQATGIWAVDRLLPGAATGVALRGSTTFSPWAWFYSGFGLQFGTSLGPSLRELHGPDRLEVVRAWWPLYVGAGIPLAAALGAALIRGGRRAWLMMLWVIVPWALLTVLAARNFKPWNTRYVLVVLPWLLALVSVGVMRLPRRWGAGSAVLLCALVLASLGGYYGSDRYAKADVRGAEAWVAARNPGREPILVPTVTGVYKYYDGGRTEILDTWHLPRLGTAAAADSLVAGRLGERPGAWVVLAREWAFDPRGLLVPALERAGDVEVGAQLAGVRILHWTRHAAGEQVRHDR